MTWLTWQHEVEIHPSHVLWSCGNAGYLSFELTAECSSGHSRPTKWWHMSPIEDASFHLQNMERLKKARIRPEWGKDTDTREGYWSIKVTCSPRKSCCKLLSTQQINFLRLNHLDFQIDRDLCSKLLQIMLYLHCAPNYSDQRFGWL